MDNQGKGGAPRLEVRALDTLGVIQRLEVRPARLERTRLTVPYKVIQNGRGDSMELIYRFEEEVFVPDEPASLNLASVMSAQVALNYF